MKYIQVYDMERVNELYKDGYRLHTVAVETYQEDRTARTVSKPVYMMSLQEPSKYLGVRWVMRMNLTHEKQEIPDGWKIIHHTAKEMVLVEKGEDPLYKELREWIASDGELDSVISIVEDYCG